MRVGKYTVTTSTAQRIGDPGRYVGIAHIVWDEADVTCDTSLTFHRGFDTEDAAQEHALQQIQIRVRDGQL
jgi:hypothetical protein